MYVLIVRFDVVPDRLAEFDALVETTVAAIREHEAGTLVYLSALADDVTSTRVFVEVYQDEAAFAAHEAQPHTRTFLQQREPLLRSLRVERLTSVGPAIAGSYAAGAAKAPRAADA